MIRIIACVLVGILWLSGCTSYWLSRTQGTNGPVAWHVDEAKSEVDPDREGSTYSFLLVLRELNNTAITFTDLHYTASTGGASSGPGFGGNAQGVWQLKPRGTLRFPFAVRSYCLDGLSRCSKASWLLPRYDIRLSGTSNGQPVEVVMHIELPGNPEVLKERTAKP